MDSSSNERRPASRLDRVPAQLLVVTSILSVQVGAAFGRSIFDELGAAGVTLLRVSLAALAMVVVIRPRISTWDRRAWQAAIVLGLTMGTMNLVFYLSLRTVPLGVAVTVEFMGPLVLALVQTRTPVDLLWALLAGVGVALLGLNTTSGIPLTGLALAALAGACWAGYILASAHLGQTLPGSDGLAISLVVASVIVFPFGIGGALDVLDHPTALLVAAAVALLSSVIPYGLELEALRRIPTRVFGILMSIEPATAAVAGWIVLGQALSTRELLALAVVSVASVGVTLSRRGDGPPLQPLE